MWKALTKKIFKKFKTPEGVATLGSAGDLAWLAK